MKKAFVTWCALMAVATAYGQEGSENQLSPDQQAIKQNAEAFVAAFEKGDAKAVAALWAKNGEMSLDGETIAEGRDEVEARYAEYFEGNPGAKIDVHINTIRVLGPSLAIERRRISAATASPSRTFSTQLTTAWVGVSTMSTRPITAPRATTDGGAKLAPPSWENATFTWGCLPAPLYQATTTRLARAAMAGPLTGQPWISQPSSATARPGVQPASVRRVT